MKVTIKNAYDILAIAEYTAAEVELTFTASDIWTYFAQIVSRINESPASKFTLIFKASCRLNFEPAVSALKGFTKPVILQVEEADGVKTVEISPRVASPTASEPKSPASACSDRTARLLQPSRGRSGSALSGLASGAGEAAAAPASAPAPAFG